MARARVAVDVGRRQVVHRQAAAEVLEQERELRPHGAPAVGHEVRHAVLLEQGRELPERERPEGAGVPELREAAGELPRLRLGERPIFVA